MKSPILAEQNTICNSIPCPPAMQTGYNYPGIKGADIIYAFG